jgi:hypothetical protein
MAVTNTDRVMNTANTRIAAVMDTKADVMADTMAEDTAGFTGATTGDTGTAMTRG